MSSGKPIDRRLFLKKALCWGHGFLWGLMSVCRPRDSVMASLENEQLVSKARHLSLREIADSRLHHGDGRFLNPFNSAGHGNFLRVLSWKLFHRSRFERFYKEQRVNPVMIDWAPVKAHKGCAVTFLKHASVMIRDLDRTLLVDPAFFSLFWIEDFSPLAFELNRMPAPDHVLITHGHYDHMDKRSLKGLGSDYHVITPLGYDGVFEEFKTASRTRLDWFESYREGGREVLFLPCNHWTMRNPFVGPNDSLWGAYLIKCAGGLRIFISGDAAYFDHYGELGKMGPIDLAVFNLGAYEPRWFMKGSHMNPEEVVKAFIELGAKRLLAVHWGGFRLGDEPVHFPPMDIRREMEKQGIADRLIHLDPGQTLFYDPSGETRIG
ncbi:MAG: MBL fold metallo-hydrolase [Pseudomonadota bacterium]